MTSILSSCAQNIARSARYDCVPTAMRSIAKFTGVLARFNEDPYADPDFIRAPLHDAAEVIVIGGGFGGLLAAARLREIGGRQHPYHRKGRRFRRCLVLESLSRRRL